MCSPLAIGLSALQTIATVKAQKIQKKMQEVQQERASKAEDNRFLSQIMSLRVKEKQENEAASQKLIAAQTKTMEAVSTADATDNGYDGNNLAAIYADIEQADANYRSSVYRQLEFNDDQRFFELDSAFQGSANKQIAINKPIAPVDYLGAAVQGVSTGMSTQGSIKQAGLSGGIYGTA